MKRHATDRPMGSPLVYTAAEQVCITCGRALPVCQTISRLVQELDGQFLLVRRDRQCARDCPGPRPFFHAPRDLRVVLPNRIYGLGVTLYVGEHHLSEGTSLSRITRDLNRRGVPVDQRHTCRIFRDFLSLAALARGDEEALQTRLRAQGGIVLMCDGVQFDDRSPVLYLAWDALSGTPLFGERKPYRSEEDLVPLLERVRDMGVPLIGVVTDKEKGLVSAVQRVFPEVPYQFCHTHFLKNCAKPLQNDLSALQTSLRRRADKVREIAHRLESLATPAGKGPISTAAPIPMTKSGETVLAVEPSASVPATAKVGDVLPAAAPSAPVPVAALSETEFVREACELVRANSRVSGKAPLDPAELRRHDRLEEVRALVGEARKKKTSPRPGPVPGPCSTNSTMP